MDPLSYVLSMMNVESAQPVRLEAGGPWALRFDGYRRVKFAAVLTGSCWIALEGLEPVRVEAGDCYLVNAGAPYRMSRDRDPGTEPVYGPIAFRAAVDGVLRYGTADEVVVVGGPIMLDEGNARLLLDVLPPFVHVPGDSAHAEALHAALRLLAHENSAPGLGAAFMTERIAQIIFVQALRAQAAAGGGSRAGWLVALMDPQIGPALRLMHEQAARQWTVPELAAAAGMSRSSFAQRFKEVVGSAPLEYLLRWRMHAAARDLRGTDRTIHSIASAWGYGSESAFSNAFKRVMGRSPRAYRVGAAHREGDGGPRTRQAG
ncbi:AraC family transcriptional regulator [Sphaerisporangium melleum]|uniref:AraC family transcriptional regulator n=1 Tax=Sphaerisporangium melleum TaxID=321316 RepID=A0A917RCI3_9ACTN|nr:AraC family transcriptional regulator [Sphaerisporangium melleum]GGL00924.1 AraC family transcriptional regulator [Sphaerisporangium melleum]GII71622.1 AraC family transcriptional regulator [Sphaerisporangium melleum]